MIEPFERGSVPPSAIPCGASVVQFGWSGGLRGENRGPREFTTLPGRSECRVHRRPDVRAQRRRSVYLNAATLNNGSTDNCGTLTYKLKVGAGAYEPTPMAPSSQDSIAKSISAMEDKVIENAKKTVKARRQLDGASRAGSGDTRQKEGLIANGDGLSPTVHRPSAAIRVIAVIHPLLAAQRTYLANRALLIETSVSR